jgi:hypothetical protein
MAHVTTIGTEQVQVLPPAAAPGLVMEEPPPTPEQIRAAEEVFAQDPESEAVAGLWGMWAGTLVLHSLAADALASAAHEEDEDELTNNKKKKPDPETSQP